MPAELTEALIGRRLDALPALPRTVFLLHHLDGLDRAAIGVRLGIGACRAGAGARDAGADLG